MALVACPECGHQISDTAISCPNCGYPLRATAAIAPVDSGQGAGQGTAFTLPASPLSFGLSGTCAAFWWGTSAMFGITSLLSLAAFGTWSMFRDGGAGLGDLIDSENLASGMLGLSGLTALISGVLLLIWMYQAYVSAELRGATERRWGRGWTIGGWFIPFANLVIPKLVMNEIDRMSSPGAGSPPIGNQWRHLPRLLWSDLWWIALLTGWTLNAIASAVYASAPTYFEDSNGIAYLGQVAGSAILAAAAAMAGVTVLSIGRRLRETQVPRNV